MKKSNTPVNKAIDRSAATSNRRQKIMIVRPMEKDADGKVNTFEILYWSTSSGSLIRWIKKNPHISFMKKEYDRPLTDDLCVFFEYKGYRFSLETPFTDYWIQTGSEDCPESIVLELIDYLRRKRVSKIRQWFVKKAYRKRGITPHDDWTMG
jgi:hypothetical protein